MSWYSRLVGGWRAWRRPANAEQELDEELASYVDAAKEAHGRLGLGPRDAERAARLAVGSAEAVKDYTRDVGWESTVGAFVQDIRDALRRLWHSPAFTIGAVGTLAVALGANLAIFTLIDRVLLHPLDVRDPDRLFVFEQSISNRGQSTPSLYAWWASADRLRHMGTVEGAAVVTRALDPATRRLEIAGAADQAPEPVGGRFVSSNFFRVLGVDMAFGRGFAVDDDAPGAPPTAVLSHAFWQRRFAADPATIGRTISVNGVQTTVIGVAPATFTGVWMDAPRPALFLPVETAPRLATDPGYVTTDDGRSILHMPGVVKAPDNVSRLSPLSSFVVIARVGRGREGRARGELASLQAAGALDRRTGRATWRLVPLLETLLPLDAKSSVRAFMTVLGGAVGLTLLLGCANLASLLAARVDDRREEGILRAALGASRARLIRPIVVEAAVIAAAGGLAATLAAHWIERALGAFVLPGAIAVSTLPATSPVRIFFWTTVLAAGVAVLIGIAPTMRVPRWGLSAAGRRHRPAAGRVDVTRVLVGAQAALGVVLVFAAVLFARTMLAALSTDLGFDPHGLMAASLSIRDQDADALAGFTRSDAFLTHVRTLPGVVAATAGAVPLADVVAFPPIERLSLDGAPPTTPSVPIHTAYVADDYFRTLRQPLLRGRAFSDSDRMDTEPVVILSASAARRFWPRGDAVGHHLAASSMRSSPGPAALVIGVAGDVALEDLHDTAPLVIYRARSQNRSYLAGYTQGSGRTPVIIRTNGDAAAFAPVVTRFARDAGFPVESVRTVGDAVDDLLMPQRLGRALLTLLGALALVLTIVGAYGLVSSVVIRDRKAVGVRIALGARPRHVVSAVLAQIARPIVVGLAVGMLIAWWGGRFADRFLYGARSHDLVTLAVACGAIVVSGLLASAWPLRRALRIDPIETLRVD
jgi:predicted permease